MFLWIDAEVFRNDNRIESIDINPFLVLPKGQGAFAVDAMIVPINEVE